MIGTLVDLTKVLFNWQILLVAGCLLVIFPLIFLVSSLDKSPVRIKRVKVHRRPAPVVKKAPERPPPEDDDLPEF